jgi:hypothetical protein
VSLAVFLLVCLVAIVALGYVIAERIIESATGLRRRVLVNLVDGRAFTGILHARRRNLLVLKNASLLEKGLSPVELDGTVVVERDRVDFMQVAG